MRFIISGLISVGIMYGIPAVGSFLLSTLRNLPITVAREGVVVAVAKGLGAILIWVMLYNFFAYFSKKPPQI
jgi:hypothetical protein